MFIIGNKDKKKLQSFFGPKSQYSLFFLKKWTMRVRKLLMHKRDQTPEIFKLVCNGVPYKLIITHEEGNNQISKIYEIYKMIEGLGYTPKVLYKENNFILTEFLTGNFASFNDQGFENNLGKFLANIHKIKPKKISKEKILIDVKNFLKNLEEVVSFNENIYQKIETELPENLIAGLTYGDHNVDNYLWVKNSLKLIDFGSFVYGDIIDIHLCSSPFFNKMNFNKFKTSYLDNGGMNQIFKYNSLLKTIALLRNASYNFDRYKTSPFYDWRMVNDRITNVKNALTNDEYLKNNVLGNKIKNFYFPKNIRFLK